MNEDHDQLFTDVAPHELAGFLAVRDPAFGLQSMDLLMRTRWAELHESVVDVRAANDDFEPGYPGAGAAVPSQVLRSGAEN